MAAAVLAADAPFHQPFDYSFVFRVFVCVQFVSFGLYCFFGCWWIWKLIKDREKVHASCWYEKKKTKLIEQKGGVSVLYFLGVNES